MAIAAAHGAKRFAVNARRAAIVPRGNPNIYWPYYLCQSSSYSSIIIVYLAGIGTCRGPMPDECYGAGLREAQTPSPPAVQGSEMLAARLAQRRAELSIRFQEAANVARTLRALTFR